MLLLIHSLQSVDAHGAQPGSRVVLHVLGAAQDGHVSSWRHLLADLALALIRFLQLQCWVAVVLDASLTRILRQVEGDWCLGLVDNGSIDEALLQDLLVVEDTGTGLLGRCLHGPAGIQFFLEAFNLKLLRQSNLAGIVAVYRKG